MYIRRCHNIAVRRRTQRPNASLATIHVEFSGHVWVSLISISTLGGWLAAQMNKRDDEGAAANSGVLFFLWKVFYVNWKCNTDGGGFVAVNGGLHKSEATPNHYAEFG